MFREMRRFRQQLTAEESAQHLREGTTAVLGVLGDDGYPYTVPVNYVYADGKIYFHGAKAGHKFDAITRCDKVSLCVVAQSEVVREDLTTYFKSVIVFGRARVLETEEEVFRAAELLGLRFNPDHERVDGAIRSEWNALCCVEIAIEHMTGKEAIELTRARAAQS